MIIIGLGNIGNEYDNTPHNVAWMVFDNLISDDSLWQRNKYASSMMATTSIGEKEVYLVKPETFMNNSGEIIPYLLKEYNIGIDDIIVIHDDIDLPLGSIRISYDRGDGGHNGVKSITQALDSKAFMRIRIGVSFVDETGNLHKPNVLNHFSKENVEKVKELSKNVAKILTLIIEKGREKAMNVYN